MIKRAYIQDATYWGSPVSNGVGGSAFGAPTPLKVRWEDKRIEFTNPNGEILLSSAEVWVKDVLDIGGYLLLGTSTVVDPTQVEGAYLIQQFLETPDLRSASSERRVFL